MNLCPLYFASTIFSLVGIWFVWDFGIRGLQLDSFRERLFELRYQLFELAADGRIRFDNHAYVALEQVLNALLHFGHRMTLWTFLLAKKQHEAQRQLPSYRDHAAELEEQICAAPSTVQPQVREILHNAQIAVFLYVVRSSLTCRLALMLASPAFFIRLSRTRQQKQASLSEQQQIIVCAVEREALREVRFNSAQITSPATL